MSEAATPPVMVPQPINPPQSVPADLMDRGLKIGNWTVNLTSDQIIKLMAISLMGIIAWLGRSMLSDAHDAAAMQSRACEAESEKVRTWQTGETDKMRSAVTGLQMVIQANTEELKQLRSELRKKRETDGEQ